MRYFRPFEGYALFLLQKHLVDKVSHLNPPSRKNNSCMLRMPMFSQDNAKIYLGKNIKFWNVFVYCLISQDFHHKEAENNNRFTANS